MATQPVNWNIRRIPWADFVPTHPAKSFNRSQDLPIVIPRAFPERLPIANAEVRRNIAETFEFRPFHADGVHEIFAKEHPDLEHSLGRGMARALVGWCVYLHEPSRLEATVRGTSFFDKNEEALVGLDAACRHWHHHGIEWATPQELQELKEQLFGPKHPAWRRFCAKHPAGDGV
jgi:hypothetical protein